MEHEFIATCYNVSELKYFIGLLPNDIISTEGKTLTINADAGKVVWVWVEYVKMFCIDGVLDRVLPPNV